MSNPKSKKFLIYLFVGIIVVVSLTGMISSSVAASRAGVTTARNPSILSALSNSANILIGLSLFYIIYKMSFDGESMST